MGNVQGRICLEKEVSRGMTKTPEELLGIKQNATEETLQSIERTLKRIEVILLQLQNQSFVLDVQDQFLQQLGENLIGSHVESE